MNKNEEPEDPTLEPEAPEPEVTASRTQRKREALDLQKIGQRLVTLPPNDLASVPLPAEMLDAIALWKRIGSNEARRRQIQFIGKLMRRIDLEPIQGALDRIDGNSAQARSVFHALENWRDRLIEEPQALTEYLTAHPLADRQTLRHQIARVRKSTDDNQRKTQSRALFRLLKEFEDQN